MPYAKTTRPSVQGIVSRTRLFRLLDRARHRPIVWVSGPPGAGKTAAVASYVAARRLRGLWYQVDGGDADVATFFYYLGHAAPRRRRSLPLLTPEYRQGLAAFTRRYFRELFGRLTPPFALVLDNYQEVPPDSALHDVMREALSEIPTAGRMIVISRSDPPPAFARSRAQQAMETVGWPELRFTTAEATRLVRKLAPGPWPGGTLRPLYELVDGWAAGLVLLLDQLHREGRTSLGPTQSSSEVLFDYFATEVFERFDADTKEVLLQSAFVPRVTASMAEALTAQPAAPQVLASLFRHNYFTTRRVGGDPVYEFHPLFRQFLLARARQTYTPARRAEINQTGARLLQSAGQVEGAAALFREAEDWEGVAQLIRAHAGTLLAQGRIETLEEFLGDLPEAIVTASPWLLYWRAMCRLNRPADCRRDAEGALASFRAHADAAGAYLAWALGVYTVACEGQDARPFDRWIALLTGLRREFPAFPSEEVEARVAFGMLTAFTWRQPQHLEAPGCADRAFELAQRHPDPLLRVQTWFCLLVYYIELGNLAGAAAAAEELQHIAQAPGIPPVVTLTALTALAWTWLIGAFDVSLRAASDGLDLLRTCAFPSAHHVLLLQGAMASFDRGDLPAAASRLREMAGELGATAQAYVLWYHECVLWEALLRGKIAHASAAAQSVLVHCDTGWPFDEAVGRLMALHALHAAGEGTEAGVQLSRVLEIGEQMGSRFVLYMARLAEAHIAFDEGREDEGLCALRKAMALGREGGYSTTYGWQPAVMARLCARALEAGIEVEYVRALVQKRRLVLERPSVEIEQWPWPVKIFTLGRFELLRDGEPVRFKGKAQKRPLDLLRTLIALGGENVAEHRLADVLWPDADGDSAKLALTTTLHRLRRLLGREDAVLRQAGRVGLNPSHCWLDLWALAHRLRQAEAAIGGSSPSDEAWAKSAEWTEQAVRLYQGDLFGEDPESSSEVPFAAGLRDRLVRQIQTVARHWEQQGDWRRAADCHLRAMDINPCSEECCRALMGAYQRLGRRDEALTVYRRCSRVMQERLGIRPSAETLALVETLTSGAGA